MKKKIIKGLVLVFLLGSLAYFTMTPIGALRLAIINSRHPVSAFTFELNEKTYPMYLEDNQIGYSLLNPPVEKQTESSLENWRVTKHWIFYTGEYYGWG